MPDSGGQKIKYLFACIFGIILLLVVVKALDLSPTEANVGPVSVKFGSLAPNPPPQSGAAPQSNAALEEELQRIKGELQRLQQGGTATPAPGLANIAGVWQSNAGIFNIVQYGAQIGVQLVNFGVVVSAGQGTISGRSINFTYINNLYQTGTAQGTISADNSQIEITANAGTLAAQRFTLTR